MSYNAFPCFHQPPNLVRPREDPPCAAPPEPVMTAKRSRPNAALPINGARCLDRHNMCCHGQHRRVEPIPELTAFGKSNRDEPYPSSLACDRHDRTGLDRTCRVSPRHVMSDRTSQHQNRHIWRQDLPDDNTQGRTKLKPRRNVTAGPGQNKNRCDQ